MLLKKMKIKLTHPGCPMIPVLDRGVVSNEECEEGEEEEGENVSKQHSLGPLSPLSALGPSFAPLLWKVHLR